ncbi:cell division protein ZapA [Bacillus sp. H-16]|uniref:Cell division protein ZapA n=1 Tax=Alteribacter keqinensis TaxID=2483800 RepID=A0A3M7TXE0_9BACI|nr:cell division protein ZapA [Alteribacter keqinensis]MBM7096514.1 cell division protein ZapA [Alteribacter salitolerans]RNA70277.1 cell division protein ZapA [Alteribacter keqinensis]
MGEGTGKSRTIVTIYGQQYTIVGQESPDHVKEVAGLVNDKMKEIKGKNPYLDTGKLAVLAALNIGDELVKLKEKHNNQEKDGE